VEADPTNSKAVTLQQADQPLKVETMHARSSQRATRPEIDDQSAPGKNNLQQRSLSATIPHMNKADKLSHP
jgi:hypothetical protein